METAQKRQEPGLFVLCFDRRRTRNSIRWRRIVRRLGILIWALLLILGVLLRWRWCRHVRVGRFPYVFPSCHTILAIPNSFLSRSLRCLAGSLCSKIACIHECAPVTHLHNAKVSVPLCRLGDVLVWYRVLPNTSVCDLVRWKIIIDIGSGLLARGDRGGSWYARFSRRCNFGVSFNSVVVVNGVRLPSRAIHLAVLLNLRLSLTFALGFRLGLRLKFDLCLWLDLDLRVVTRF